jgi:hypothetical protein
MFYTCRWSRNTRSPPRDLFSSTLTIVSLAGLQPRLKIATLFITSIFVIIVDRVAGREVFDGYIAASFAQKHDDRLTRWSSASIEERNRGYFPECVHFEELVAGRELLDRCRAV